VVGRAVRSWTVPTADIRIARPSDGPALAALRREWTAEDHGDVADEDFEPRFLDWYERESGHRVSWLGEVCGRPVGMMNLVIFERMPRPGLDTGTWGYLANAFVLTAYRNQGIGALLLAAVLGYADEHAYVRVVLRPSERAIPFYRRAGFVPDGGFLVRPGRSLLFVQTPDPGHNSLRLILINRHEVVHGVAALGGIQEGRELPRQVARERLVDLPFVALHASEYANRPVSAAAFVKDRIIGNLLSHVFSGTPRSRLRQVE